MYSFRSIKSFILLSESLTVSTGLVAMPKYCSSSKELLMSDHISNQIQSLHNYQVLSLTMTFTQLSNSVRKTNNDIFIVPNFTKSSTEACRHMER